jgi:heme/copper-type cytochrome/quinol oxidase subunit 2
MSPTPEKRQSERVLLTLVIVPSLFLALFPLLKPLSPPPTQTAPGSREVLVLASAGELGGFKPSEIKLVAGEHLHISFWAMDVAHSFNLPQLGIDLVLSPGEATELNLDTTFEENATEYAYFVNGKRFPFPKVAAAPAAPQPLVFEFKCNRYCSPAHWGMRGQLVVDPPLGRGAR